MNNSKNNIARWKWSFQIEQPYKPNNKILPPPIKDICNITFLMTCRSYPRKILWGIIFYSFVSSMPADRNPRLHSTLERYMSTLKKCTVTMYHSWGKGIRGHLCVLWNSDILKHTHECDAGNHWTLLILDILDSSDSRIVAWAHSQNVTV